MNHQCLADDKKTGIQYEQWRQKMSGQDFSRGAFYMIVAQKMVTPLRPIKERYWSPIKVGSLAGLKPMQTRDRRSKNKEEKA